MSTAKRKIEVEMPTFHDGQLEILRTARRWNVVACGRRWGKTTMGINLLILPALEGYPVSWYSPTYKMLAEVWRELKRIAQPITARTDAQQHRLELLTGGVIDCWSLENIDAPRGRKYKRAIIDEAAMIANLEEGWQASIRPTLTDFQGDGFFLSTPKGMNYFADLFADGQDAQKPEWASWQKPTLTNPFIVPSEIEAARQELPERTFRQEYLAEFLQNDGAVFRNIAACLNAKPTTPAEHAKHRKLGGIDWAQKEDFTVISIFCQTCKREIYLERFNQIGWAIQCERIVKAHQTWRLAYFLAEENSIGSPNIEALQREQIPVRPFQTTAVSKPPLIQSLALAFERTEAQWLPDAVAKSELERYESRISQQTGRVSYSAPPGRHDDTVIARALAWFAASLPPGQIVSFN